MALDLEYVQYDKTVNLYMRWITVYDLFGFYLYIVNGDFWLRFLYILTL